MVGDRAVSAGAGTWVSAPPGARHGFRNVSVGSARLLSVHAPETGSSSASAGRVERPPEPFLGNTLAGMEPTGIEPVTSCVQGRRSPS